MVYIIPYCYNMLIDKKVKVNGGKIIEIKRLKIRRPTEEDLKKNEK